jgi:hypothetical protein
MMNYDDELEALVNSTTEWQKKKQDTRVEKEGEVQMHAVFKSYAVFDVGLHKNVEQDTPPDKKFNQTKDGKKQYRAQLTTENQVLSFNTVPDQCERLPNGEDGWRVFCKLSYNDRDGENVKQWLAEHYDSFYNGKYVGKFPIGEYIDEEGTLADYKWVKVYPKSMTKVKVNDSDEVVFRRRVGGKDTGPFVVGPYTPLTFYKCSASQFVTLRKETEDGTTFVPQAYTSFSAKAVELNETHDATLPITERLHVLENKDVHNMIPVEALSKGGAVPQSAYFWASKYRSPNGCETGVHIYKLKSDAYNLDDFLSTFKEETKPGHTIRLSVFQWKTDPGNNREMYSVKVVSRNSDLWKNYGITDMTHYARILYSSYSIPVHVTADLWSKSVTDNPANKPETLKHLSGVYTYGAKSLIPDFIHFYNTGLAHRISKERVKSEFKRFTSTNAETGETEMTLKPTLENKQNPLNGDNPTTAPVFALGNGKIDDPNAKRTKPLFHAYDGDLCEVLEDSVFFVLSSHEFKSDPDELSLVQDEARGDALLDEWIEKENVYYWIFGIQKKYVKRTPKEKQAVVVVAAPSSHKKRPKKVEEEEDEKVEIEKEEEAPKKTKTTTKKK